MPTGEPAATANPFSIGKSRIYFQSRCESVRRQIFNLVWLSRPPIFGACSLPKNVTARRRKKLLFSAAVNSPA
jgi:hypothetical protein